MALYLSRSERLTGFAWVESDAAVVLRNVMHVSMSFHMKGMDLRKVHGFVKSSKMVALAARKLVVDGVRVDEAGGRYPMDEFQRQKLSAASNTVDRGHH